MLVGLLYHMCKVKLVNQSKFNDQINTINDAEIHEARHNCTETLKTINPEYCLFTNINEAYCDDYYYAGSDYDMGE